MTDHERKLLEQVASTGQRIGRHGGGAVPTFNYRKRNPTRTDPRTGETVETGVQQGTPVMGLSSALPGNVNAQFPMRIGKPRTIPEKIAEAAEAGDTERLAEIVHGEPYV